jgi:hypothetical protein
MPHSRVRLNVHCSIHLRLKDSADPMTRYEYLVEKGTLKPDDHQKGIIQHLQRLWKNLQDYDPGSIPPEETEIKPSFVSDQSASCVAVPDNLLSVTVW